MKRIAFAVLLVFAALSATTAAAWADSSITSTVTDEAP